SLAMTRAHPAFGVGPGNWSVLYPKFASRHDQSMSQSVEATRYNPWPSSDWAAFLSERGVLGCLLLALVMVGLMIRAVRDVRDGIGHYPDTRLTQSALS